MLFTYCMCAAIYRNHFPHNYFTLCEHDHWLMCTGHQLQPSVWQPQLLNDIWKQFYQDQWTLLQYCGQSLSLCPATCQMVGCFAYGLIVQTIVIQSKSNAYSAQNRSVLSESQDGCWGMYKWYLSWWRENAQWFITEETQEKCSSWALSPFPFT